MLQSKLLKNSALSVAAITLVTIPSAAASPDASYIFNTLLFLLGGILVMWMAAGFAMLEAGLVRSKNVAEICLKNVSLYALACIMWMLMGYDLMYTGVDGGFVGTFFSLWSPNDAAALAEGAQIDPAGYSAGSDFFFQMVFVATTASIVSGTVAERIKLFPFLIFTAVLAGFIYPVQGAWKWGAGWLDAAGFVDFAGSTIVHSVGGWAALIGAIVVGPRLGRYTDRGIKPMPGSSMPLATLGTFILWMGWFGFNGASQLALGSVADSVAISNIFVNTNMAAAGGSFAAILVTKLIYKKVDLSMALNGALAGLVSITAGPDTPTPVMATVIGSVGGALVVFAVPFFDKLKIDDVVGAVSVHLVCGVWGTLAVPLTNQDATFFAQLQGVLAVGAFVCAASLVTWLALKYTLGVRLDPLDEERGSDIAELGMEAYPEFGKGSQKF